MSEIRMPSLGAEMEAGTVIEWYVQPGDAVVYGQIVALLDTEKAEIEMESFVAGTIEQLLVAPGETVAVGTPMARLRETAADAATPPAPTVEPPPPAHAAAPTPAPISRAPSPPTPPERPPSPATPPPSPPPSPAPSTTPSTAADRVRATPLARRLAAERGVDLAQVAGTGPHGAIVGDDVTQAASTPIGDDVTRAAPPPVGPAPPSAADGAREPGRGTPGDTTAGPISSDERRRRRRREIIAAAMSRSKREIPHYYLSTPIAVDRALDWLERYNAGRPLDERILLPALLMKSVALAARAAPSLNGHWQDGAFHGSEAVHLGLVVSLRTGGLVVPTFRDTDRRSLLELMGELRDVVGRARAGRLRSAELGEATISLTSLGERGAETIFGVVYPPQVAIVGLGGVHPGLVSENGLIGTRPTLRASLSADHRASDGQEGSRFLELVARHLRDPETL